MKKFLLFALCSLLFTVLISCATQTGMVEKGEIKRVITQEAVGEDYITAIGIGAADPTMDNKTQRMATSRNAAVVAAQYEMLTVIKGVKLEGGITVEKAMETDSLLATKVDAEIKGAEIIKTEWTADDGCVITLRLPKNRLKAMGLKMIK